MGETDTCIYYDYILSWYIILSDRKTFIHEFGVDSVCSVFFRPVRQCIKLNGTYVMVSSKVTFAKISV